MSSYPLRAASYAQWDAAQRHEDDQARQIRAAIAAKRYGSAWWALWAMRDEEARAMWKRRIEEAERGI